MQAICAIHMNRIPGHAGITGDEAVLSLAFELLHRVPGIPWPRVVSPHVGHYSALQTRNKAAL